MSSTPILGIPQLAPTQVDKTTSINDAVLALEGATQDQTTISLSAGDVTLTNYQFTHYAAFLCTGNTVARSLIVPATKRVFVVKNGGTAVLTVGFTAGTGVSVATGGAVIQSDGTTISLLAAGGPGPAGPTGPAGPISTLVAGAGLGNTTLVANGTINADWNAGTVTAIGGGLSLAAGTLAATFQSGGAGLDINAGAVSAHWQSGTVTAIGTGLTVISGTLEPTAFGGTVSNIVTGAGLAGGPITTNGTITLDLGHANAWTAPQRGVPAALTDATSIAVDLSRGNNFTLTLGGNHTLANPTNVVAGQAGQIVITQDGTGARTLAFASEWKFAGGAAPVLSTAAGAVDILSYFVIDSTHIAITAALAFS